MESVETPEITTPGTPSWRAMTSEDLTVAVWTTHTRELSRHYRIYGREIHRRCQDHGISIPDNALYFASLGRGRDPRTMLARGAMNAPDCVRAHFDRLFSAPGRLAG